MLGQTWPLATSSEESVGNRSMAGVVSQADCWEGCNKEDPEWGRPSGGMGKSGRGSQPRVEPRKMGRICHLSEVGEARWWPRALEKEPWGGSSGPAS